MARSIERKAEGNRAAIYARVSDKSQDTEDKTSISEQTIDMEAYCESRGLNITARYQEVGRGWTKKRPEFQRMLADAREGRFDTIVCWKSDRLSRGMHPAAALLEVVEAHQVRLEAVMDSIDMKTFGLMAAIGKIELDNFRERASMGKRGKAKQGRMPNGSVPYGYRVGEDGKPVVYEPEAEVVRHIFRLYVHEGMVGMAIARQLSRDNAPTWKPGSRWHNAYVCALLGKEVYKGTWWYGKARWTATEGGEQVFRQPEETWIEIPFPPLVDEQTWDRAQAIKKERTSLSKRNTKIFYLLQHLLRCAECGLLFACRSKTRRTEKHKGKTYSYDYKTPQRHYHCYGMQREHLRCRERPYIRADRLEELVWSEVKKVVQNPDLIRKGQNPDLIREGIEDQLDHQRKLILERLEAARAKLDDYRAQESLTTKNRILMENVVKWIGRVGNGLDNLSSEERRDVLRLVVDQIAIDRDNRVTITLGIPAEDLVSVEKEASRTI